MTVHTSWPVTHSVGVTSSLWHGGGSLTIAPGLLVCTPGRLTAKASGAKPVRHSEGRVEIFVARLVPPWFNVSLVVRGEAGTLIASTWLPSLKRLRETLTRAGFQVTVRRTWVYRGYRWNDPR